MLDIKSRKKGFTLIESSFTIAIFLIFITFIIDMMFSIRIQRIYIEKYDEKIKFYYYVKEEIKKDMSFEEIIELKNISQTYYVEVKDIKDIKKYRIKDILNLNKTQNDNIKIKIIQNTIITLEMELLFKFNNKEEVIKTKVYKGEY